MPWSLNIKPPIVHTCNLRNYKFRLYPTPQQETLLNATIETCRRLFNSSLEERSRNYVIGFYGQKRLLTERRRENKYQRHVHSQVLQDVLLRLDKAYQAFFKGLSRYPRFKRQDRYNSFTYPQIGGFSVDGEMLRLGLTGKIRIKLHRPIAGTMKTCTIVRDVDQWYACISVQEEGQERKPTSSEAIGIDLGLFNLAVMSNGEVIENQKYFYKSIATIKKLQRNIAKKKKGSKNRAKAKLALTKAWRKVRRQRDDHAHKVSTKIASQYGMVVFEKLSIDRMVKNHKLAAAIMDATWGKLRQLTAYKVERRSGRVILVDPNGTSQKCSGCGAVVWKDLSVRVHECQSCGLVLDRDHNAALNILKLGLEQARAEEEPLLVRRTSKFSRGSKKPTLSSVGSSPPCHGLSLLSSASFQ